jgi:hypothetical protein
MQSANSHRHFLKVLFYLFETMLLVSVLLHWSIDPRRQSQLDEASGITFLYSFVGQLIVCFLLRRTARDLALIGWITLTGAFLSSMFLPAIP